jgi:hypothetical protein
VPESCVCTLISNYGKYGMFYQAKKCCIWHLA